MISGSMPQTAALKAKMAAVVLAGCAIVLAYSSGPPDGKTGRPGEGTCLDCHSGPAGSADSSLLVGFPTNTYKPDSTYMLVLGVMWAGQTRWGFELTAVDRNGNRAGQLFSWDSLLTQYSNTGPGYLKHTLLGTLPGRPSPMAWLVGWRAPAAGAGPVRFYWCCNAANNSSSPAGDTIIRDSMVVTESSGAVEEQPAQARHFWRSANPSRNRVVIDYEGDEDRPVRIYARDGRMVRALLPSLNGELLRVTWDGREADGKPATDATYFVRLDEGIRSVVKVQLVR